MGVQSLFWTEFSAVAWKTALVYFLLVGLTRLIGQKLLARATFFDFVIGITIGSIGGAYVVTSTPGYFVLFSPIILAFLVLATGFFAMKSRRFRSIIEGEPVILIREGAIQYENLRRTRYHVDNLLSDLRVQGIFDISRVECAILEPHGRLSVVERDAGQSPTPVELIKDGEVLEWNLKQANLTRKWLDEQLRGRGIMDCSKVIYACLSTDGKMYTDIRQDNSDHVHRVED